MDLVVAVYARGLGREDGPEFRAWLVDRFEASADSRADRYWRLVGRVTDAGEWDPETTAAWHWILAALRKAASPP